MYNPVFNLGFRVHSLANEGNLFLHHFLITTIPINLDVCAFGREVRGGGTGERDMTNLIKCNDCGDSLNLGQRILNSKRVQGSKLCGRCHQKELKAWKNGEFDAHDGKEYEGKQRILTQSERRERRERKA